MVGHVLLASQPSRGAAPGTAIGTLRLRHPLLSASPARGALEDINAKIACNMTSMDIEQRQGSLRHVYQQKI
jgi:hypothetical protein